MTLCAFHLKIFSHGNDKTLCEFFYLIERKIEQKKILQSVCQRTPYKIVHLSKDFIKKYVKRRCSKRIKVTKNLKLFYERMRKQKTQTS